MGVPESGSTPTIRTRPQIPQASAANTMNVSYRILAEVEFTKDSEGVIFAQGSRRWEDDGVRRRPSGDGLRDDRGAAGPLRSLPGTIRVQGTGVPDADTAIAEYRSRR